MIQVLILLLALVAANVPWISNKLFTLVVLKDTDKSLAWCLTELVILYFVIGAIAVYAEYASLGQIAPQSWEFYAVTFSLFLVFAFPGFVYKLLWKK